jgi:hypothetical protein
MERQSRAHINPDFGAFSALGLRIAALSASRISAVANASHVLPNGAAVRNARSLATICRAICSFDIRISVGPVKSKDPARKPIGSGFDRLAKRDCERGIWRIALHESSQANVSALLMVFVFLTSREVRPQVP